jgi:hypothetical protein
MIYRNNADLGKGVPKPHVFHEARELLFFRLLASNWREGRSAPLSPARSTIGKQLGNPKSNPQGLDRATFAWGQALGKATQTPASCAICTGKFPRSALFAAK